MTAWDWSWLSIQFQSTLLQEERPYNADFCWSRNYFNPRSYKRSDDTYFCSIYYKNKISIHAPTRGATYCIRHSSGSLSYFNPRSYKRSDANESIINHDMQQFQSTLLQEERRSSRYWYQSIQISIHAPTRGATSPVSGLMS